MKTFLSLALLSGLLAGCSNGNSTLPVTTTVKIAMSVDGTSSVVTYNIVAIEGHEYFATYTAGAFLNLCHKANCTNSIHTSNER